MDSALSVEYDIRDQLDYTIVAMLKRDDAVPDINKWENELDRRWASGLPVDGCMQEIRQEFDKLSIEQRYWCRAYGELLSYSCALGEYGHNWASVVEELQPDTADYRQSEIGQFVKRVTAEATAYYYRWSKDYVDDLETCNER